MTKENALKVVFTVLSMLKPMMADAYWTPGCRLRIASILLVTSSVRWREASRKLDVQVEVPLVLHRQEAVRERAPKKPAATANRPRSSIANVRLSESSNRRSAT